MGLLDPIVNLQNIALHYLRDGCRLEKYDTVVSPFYGLCEIFWKATTIYGVLRFQKPPNMAFKQNWRKSSTI
jgi:hypothetical protein